MKIQLLVLILSISVFGKTQNDYSIRFDGTDDYIDFGNSTDFDFSNTSFTVGCWVKIGNLSPLPGIINKSDTNNYGWFLSIESNPGNSNHEKFRFSGTSSNSPDYFNVYSDVIYSAMEWHHVMAVFENGTQKFYYDGSLASSDNWNYSIVNTSTNLIVGKKEGGSFLNGSIDDVQIWNVPLTQQEIQQYMYCSPIGNENGLIGYWNFEEGSGTTAIDLTSNNNGIINGAIYTRNTPPSSGNILTIDTVNACESYTWIDGNTYIISNNSATVIETNSFGCDSVIQLNLTITPYPNTSIIENIPSLTADQFASGYQWLNCNNDYSIIIGETNQTFTPTETGNYAVAISLNGCIDTSECIPVNLSEINDFKNTFVSVYPNPVSEILEIKGLKKLTELENIEIISSKGNVLKKLEEKKEIINIKNLPPGLYFLKINLKTEARTIKFIKN